MRKKQEHGGYKHAKESLWEAHHAIKIAQAGSTEVLAFPL